MGKQGRGSPNEWTGEELIAKSACSVRGRGRAQSRWDRQVEIRACLSAYRDNTDTLYHVVLDSNLLFDYKMVQLKRLGQVGVLVSVF